MRVFTLSRLTLNDISLIVTVIVAVRGSVIDVEAVDGGVIQGCVLRRKKGE